MAGPALGIGLQLQAADIATTPAAKFLPVVHLLTGRQWRILQPLRTAAVAGLQAPGMGHDASLAGGQQAHLDQLDGATRTQQAGFDCEGCKMDHAPDIQIEPRHTQLRTWAIQLQLTAQDTRGWCHMLLLRIPYPLSMFCRLVLGTGNALRILRAADQTIVRRQGNFLFSVVIIRSCTKARPGKTLKRLPRQQYSALFWQWVRLCRQLHA